MTAPFRPCARLCIAVVLTMAVAGQAAAQDALAPARTLYASASYGEALAALDAINAPPGAPSMEVERYRVFCLMALERPADADRVIERMVTADPFYRLTESDTSPRIRKAFETIRARMLPSIVRTLYADGKAAFDRGSFDEAERALRAVVDLIDTPELINRPGIDDLRQLAAGFLQLTRERRAPGAPSPMAEVPAAGPGPDSDPPAPVPPAVTPTMTVAETTVTLSEPVVTEPVVVQQDIPPWPEGAPAATVTYRGTVVVEIDERGEVTKATMVGPIDERYDLDLLRAARTWRYEPALRDGQPVRSQKRIEVELRPQ